MPLMTIVSSQLTQRGALYYSMIIINLVGTLPSILRNKLCEEILASFSIHLILL